MNSNKHKVKVTDEFPFEPYDTPMRLAKTEVEWIVYMRALKTCARKHDYATEEDAMKVAIYRLTASDRDTDKLKPYKCPYCIHWHLTKA